MSDDSIQARNNVSISGRGEQVLMFAHGFGCDQNMWRALIGELKNDYRIVAFDYVGSGKSDLSAFNVSRYATLDGYACDITDILDELNLVNVTLVGHSVSAMIGMLAATRAPERISKLVMVCPSPCYINDLPDYEGGFERDDLEELIDMMDKNYIGWANYLAPLVMGGRADQSTVEELTSSFCSTDPLVAKTFARATFFSDYRELMADCQTPTLVLQSREDSLVPVSVGEFVAAKLPHGNLRILNTQGHCIHMTDPALTNAEIRSFLGAR
ncbi:MAG: alpha/beta hydrolase [Pseudohongiella sp.]|uniref:alpha/beta fold hydrolase n=1 Tax=Pseudohongiella sp. TaxID=1979412 RepID=UPI0034A013CC